MIDELAKVAFWEHNAIMHDHEKLWAACKNQKLLFIWQVL